MLVIMEFMLLEQIAVLDVETSTSLIISYAIKWKLWNITVPLEVIWLHDKQEPNLGKNMGWVLMKSLTHTNKTQRCYVKTQSGKKAWGERLRNPLCRERRRIHHSPSMLDAQFCTGHISPKWRENSITNY